MKPKKRARSKNASARRTRKARVIALGGQDPLLKRAVEVLNKSVGKHGLTWTAISAKTADFTQNSRPVSTETIARWRSGETRGAMTRTLEAALRAVNKVLDIRNVRNDE